MNLPDRCDNPECVFHTAPLEWAGKKLKLTLDHFRGNRFDNSPDNLRYLCPNCHSQCPTTGGGNIGRVQKLTADGAELMRRDGTVEFSMGTGRASAHARVDGVGASNALAAGSVKGRGTAKGVGGTLESAE